MPLFCLDITRSCIEDWKTTPWLEINVDQMESNCKRFAYEIRGMDKEMRAWDTYLGKNGLLPWSY